jgi:alpha-acetolactate decarboxylase
MKRILGLGLCFLLCGAFPVIAEESATSVQEELSVDKANIQAQKEEIKTNAQTAHSEEKALREQIQEARKAGDKAKVKELQGQLKTTHKENVQEKKQDKKELQSAKKELRKDKRAARSARR